MALQLQKPGAYTLGFSKDPVFFAGLRPTNNAERGVFTNPPSPAYPPAQRLRARISLVSIFTPGPMVVEMAMPWR